jgi:hypothetical protein
METTENRPSRLAKAKMGWEARLGALGLTENCFEKENNRKQAGLTRVNGPKAIWAEQKNRNVFKISFHHM